MSSLSIRHMNYTLQVMEHERDIRDAALFASLSDEEKAERTHYWHVERKAKRGKNKWIFQREFFGTKADAANFWNRNYRGRKDIRLHHILEYGAKHGKPL